MVELLPPLWFGSPGPSPVYPLARTTCLRCCPMRQSGEEWVHGLMAAIHPPASEARPRGSNLLLGDHTVRLHEQLSPSPGLRRKARLRARSPSMRRVAWSGRRLLQVRFGSTQNLCMDFMIELPTSSGCDTILVVGVRFSKMSNFIALEGLPSASKKNKEKCGYRDTQVNARQASKKTQLYWNM